MIRVAVIGTGNISTAHIEGYLAFPERCQIVALCDIFPEKAQAKKEKYQLNGADVVDDHESCWIGRTSILLVSARRPTAMHPLPFIFYSMVRMFWWRSRWRHPCRNAMR